MAKGVCNMSKYQSNYVESVATCACGATFTTKSTKEKIHVEQCAECHPFYTGEHKKNKPSPHELLLHGYFCHQTLTAECQGLPERVMKITDNTVNP